MTDRWVWLAHMRQIYCFSAVLGVLSTFTVYSLIIVGFSYLTRLGSAFSRFFSTSKAVAAGDASDSVTATLSSRVYRMFISNRSSMCVVWWMEVYTSYRLLSVTWDD